ncbi:hypothetical protein SVIOM74S_00913 [Streptomyces violarus]
MPTSCARFLDRLEGHFNRTVHLVVDGPSSLSF